MISDPDLRPSETARMARTDTSHRHPVELDIGQSYPDVSTDPRITVALSNATTSPQACVHNRKGIGLPHMKCHLVGTPNPCIRTIKRITTVISLDWQHALETLRSIRYAGSENLE
jgi:hypothetical protein